MGELTHFNEQGRARMVDVTEKAVTHRRAVAAGEIHVSPETMAHIKNGTMKKGDVLAVAQVAGIQAAKHNWELIPMCHPLPLTGIDITFRLSDEPCMVEIQAAVTCTCVTGVEMEALTAVSVAALTVYDMCKAVQKDMEITNIRLLADVRGSLVRGITIDLPTDRITPHLRSLLADRMAEVNEPDKGGELAFRIFDPTINRSLHLSASRRIPVDRKLVEALAEEDITFSIEK